MVFLGTIFSCISHHQDGCSLLPRVAAACRLLSTNRICTATSAARPATNLQDGVLSATTGDAAARRLAAPDTDESPAVVPQWCVHKSVGPQNNGRLIFLGASILDLLVSRELYALMPEAGEHELREMRTRLLDPEQLAWVSRQLGLDRQIICAKGSEAQVTHRVLACLFEAYLADTYISQGERTAACLVKNWLMPRMGVAPVLSPPNVKQILQEWHQRQHGSPPKYETVESTGPAHKKQFLVRLTFKNGSKVERSVETWGASVQKASVAAAQAAMSELQLER
eukprot:gnl/TRDRNA2_/TRDRNA2_173418_c0_seq4.p1 gnl/TRDRNA2_/TRDRNA2_173418_c0~~gnl/TRDRNA2_/TRDRNA2_173418_c0_seq4.p1  ORF type:complete len:294 (-),score=41.52 gnl/TRDRNA2_/TRDRNA2_173418_c0_seq4:44-889(-)